MRTIKVAHTMVSSPQVTARWARKAHSRTEHYKRRITFYLVETARIVAFALMVWWISYGSLKLMPGE